LRDLARAIRARRPAVVHTHGYKCNLMGRVAARLTGSPVVATMHSGEPGTGKLRLYLALDRLTSPLGPAIAVSPSIARRLPGRRCIVFGDGPDRGAIAAAAVDWRGMVRDMGAHWGEIGLLCMPSRHEGLPVAALEAMARGIPVAAFAVGALPDVVADGESGFLAKPGDLAALRAGVERWLAMVPAERGRMAEAARATIKQRFDRAKAVEALLAIYRQAGAA
jgi:hypothetical protein